LLVGRRSLSRSFGWTMSAGLVSFDDAAKTSFVRRGRY
jgi:hypothetical protein